MSFSSMERFLAPTRTWVKFHYGDYGQGGIGVAVKSTSSGWGAKVVEYLIVQLHWE